MSDVDSSKLRALAEKAREEYKRLGPYEDDFVRLTDPTDIRTTASRAKGSAGTKSGTIRDRT